MIRVTVEIREGAVTHRARMTAPSIEQALRIAREGKPGRRVHLVFPIDPEVFFVLGDHDRLWESMGEMSDRERRVLVRRYGLDGREPATLAELGDELGVSRERVRQLQRKAERDLRGRRAPERCRRDTSWQSVGDQ